MPHNDPCQNGLTKTFVNSAASTKLKKHYNGARRAWTVIYTLEAPDPMSYILQRFIIGGTGGGRRWHVEVFSRRLYPLCIAPIVLE